MLSGFNTNITYRNNKYHIQTEDSGVKNPVIVTLLYFEGEIIASKKRAISTLLEILIIKRKLRNLWENNTGT